MIKSNQSDQKIKVILKPKIGQTSDFILRVYHFYTTLGCEHLQEIYNQSHLILKDRLELEYILPANLLLRITVECKVGRSMNLPIEDYEFCIESPNSKVRLC